MNSLFLVVAHKGTIENGRRDAYWVVASDHNAAIEKTKIHHEDEDWYEPDWFDVTTIAKEKGLPLTLIL